MGYCHINLRQALTGSCDVYFWTVGDRVNDRDPNLFREYANRLGLGVLTGIDSISELHGNIPDQPQRACGRNGRGLWAMC